MRRINVQRRVVSMMASLLAVVAITALAACSSSSTSTQRTPSSSPGTAGVGTPTAVPTNGPFNVTLSTKYTLSSCDAGQPANTICIATSGSGQGTNNGHSLTVSGLQQSSTYAPGDGSACTSATTQGTLRMTQSDIVMFTGTGTFCRATQTATFTYMITGGTGGYAQASGTGTIHVPPPSSPTDDSETWSGTLLT